MPIETATDQPFQNLRRHADKLMEQMQKGYYGFLPNETWAPNVNLYETDAAYLVCVDLAGVYKEKIDLEIVDSRLSIRGHREVPSHGEPDAAVDAQAKHRLRVHVMEIDHGPFFRQVDLPLDVYKDRITANYRNGMLWVEIPKK